MDGTYLGSYKFFDDSDDFPKVKVSFTAAGLSRCQTIAKIALRPVNNDPVRAFGQTTEELSEEQNRCLYTGET
jgi:hypothetical protein